MSDRSRIQVRLASTAADLPVEATSDVAIVAARQDGPCLDSSLSEAARAAIEALWEDSVALMREDPRDGFEPISPLADVGKATPLPLPGQTPRLVLVVGVGAAEPRSARLAGGEAGRQLRALPELNLTEDDDVAPAEVSCVLAGMAQEAVAAFAEGLSLGGYSFSAANSAGVGERRRSRSAVSEPRAVVNVHSAEALIMGGRRQAKAVSKVESRAAAKATSEALATAATYADGAAWARDLTNTRTNIKTPAWLGEQAVRTLTPLGARVTVRDESWLSRQNFGGVLAVGSGSAAPPRLIEASWRPRRLVSDEHIVLVGKGICFDSGGYNLKPGDSMTAMYTDMAGAAAVLGALRIVAALRLPVRVTALAPAAENSVSGTAMRTGDVLRHYNGRTTEVTNTDAEGRLVLADALAYATATMEPSVIVDIATLTGAMKLALGARTAGLLATDDDLAAELEAAATEVDEPLWRMPLEREYESTLQSPIADAINSAGAPGGITAALFLRHFVGDVPWAHLDVAGPARSEADFGYVTKGATGFGARLLGKWVAGRVAQ